MVIAATFFQNPLVGNESWTISQRYNAAFFSEKKGVVVYHQGTDLVTRTKTSDLDRIGDTVRAAGDGVVVFAGMPPYAGWRKVVIVQHETRDGQAVATIYGHVKGILVSQGQVTAGQPIATMGNAEGQWPAHLHFAVRYGTFDPAKPMSTFLQTGYTAVPDPTPDTKEFINPMAFLASHANPNGLTGIFGSPGADNDVKLPGRTALFGTERNDLISGLGGDDIVQARGGDDSVVLGPGHAQAFGGDGNDIIYSFDGNEEVYLRAYASVPEARASLGRYIGFYNTRRPHSSLDGKTPDQAYFNPLLPVPVAA